MHKNDASSRKGMTKLKNESYSEYKEALKGDINKLQSLLRNNCNVEPDAVAYPYGAYTNETLNIVKECGFKCTLTCEERINYITQGQPDSLYNLGRYNRPSGISSEEFFNKILN